ncbi:MAG TPA: 50S ribosomal protein L10, partial [Bacillota bacterium]|nr:50S ribosomal protein L10 [Bacillota bacterium]
PSKEVLVAQVLGRQAGQGIKSLASLPSKEVLVAQVLGGLNAPITGFVNVLQGNIRNLVYALNAIAEKKTA